MPEVPILLRVLSLIFVVASGVLIATKGARIVAETPSTKAFQIRLALGLLLALAHALIAVLLVFAASFSLDPDLDDTSIPN